MRSPKTNSLLVLFLVAVYGVVLVVGQDSENPAVIAMEHWCFGEGVFGQCIQLATIGPKSIYSQFDIAFDSANQQYMLFYASQEYYGFYSTTLYSQILYGLTGLPTGPRTPVLTFAQLNYLKRNPAFAFDTQTNEYLAVFERESIDDSVDRMFPSVGQIPVTRSGGSASITTAISHAGENVDSFPRIAYNSNEHTFAVIHDSIHFGSNYIAVHKMNLTQELIEPSWYQYSGHGTSNPRIAYDALRDQFFLVAQVGIGSSSSICGLIAPSSLNFTFNDATCFFSSPNLIIGDLVLIADAYYLAYIDQNNLQLSRFDPSLQNITTVTVSSGAVFLPSMKIVHGNHSIMLVFQGDQKTQASMYSHSLDFISHYDIRQNTANETTKQLSAVINDKFDVLILWSSEFSFPTVTTSQVIPITTDYSYTTTGKVNNNNAIFGPNVRTIAIVIVVILVISGIIGLVAFYFIQKKRKLVRDKIKTAKLELDSLPRSD